jgi:hypothetical protein
MREIKQYKTYFFISRILIYVACSKKVFIMLPLPVTPMNRPFHNAPFNISNAYRIKRK